MKRPGWATTVGVMMILFGGCGASQDFKQIFTEELMEFQNDMIVEIETNTDEIEMDSTELAVLEKLSGMEQDSLESPLTAADHMKNLTHIPESDLAKLKLHGYIGMVVSILYALAGLLFIIRKKHVLTFAYSMLVISLLFTAYQYIDISKFGVAKILKIGLEFSILFGGLLDIILLIILAFVDKTFFKENIDKGDYYDSLDPA